MDNERHALQSMKVVFKNFVFKLSPEREAEWEEMKKAELAQKHYRETCSCPGLCYMHTIIRLTPTPRDDKGESYYD